MSKRREQEAARAEQDRKQMFTILGIIAVIAVIVVGGAVALTQFTGAATGVAAKVLPSVKAVPALKVPENAEPKGKAWGPADAPIKVEEFLDYQCPSCGAFARTYEQSVMSAFAGTGKVRWEIHFSPFLEQRKAGSTESTDAVQAVLCAAEQDKFWQMHESIFANQLITGEENIGHNSKARLKELAATIQGMDNAAFGVCLDADKYVATAKESLDNGTKKGVDATPSFFVNGIKIANPGGPDGFIKEFAKIAPNVKFDGTGK